jgi:ABC-type polysaccharide/polyol phosphate transport system ATPase subunit
VKLLAMVGCALGIGETGRRMSEIAVAVDSLWKSYRLYHERNQYLKAAILKGRRARYEEFWALKDVSFEVPTGSTFGVIGANGSGKSTLLKCLAGILIPEKGSLRVSGRISALLELGAGFHPELSGRENVYLNGAILGLSKREIAARFDDIVDFAGLADFIDTPVKNYSSGMFVRLGFAVAANVEPEVLLIDEVLSVGDEVFQRRCMEKIEDFRRDGRTIVFVSHGLAQVGQLCEDAAWIDHGDLRMIGPSAQVISEYQGTSHDATRVEGEQGARWGSGEGQIVGVTLLDGQGQTESVMSTFEPMTVKVELTAHTPLQDVVVGIAIHSLAGTHVWGSNTKRNGQLIGRLDGPASVELAIPSLPLLEGVYDLTVTLTDHTEVHPYDYWDKRIRFEVRQYRVYDSGLVHIPGTWSVRGAKAMLESNL